MSEHEQAFIASFVVPEKRGRYAEFLARPGRRGEILDRWNHLFDFVPELATTVPRSSPAEWAELLRRRGAPAGAYIMGGGLCDQSELPLAEAVERAWGSGWGVVVSCLPGRLALYLQESPAGAAFLLSARTV